jgi:protein MpaA
MVWLIYSLLSFATPLEPSILGYSNGHRPITMERLGYGEERVAFVATIHGNEYSGSVLLPLLAKELLANPEYLEDKTVLFVQMANPDAFVDGERSNRNWVDINRNFPSHNHRNSRRGGDGPLSESESRAISHLLENFNPDRIITLHEPFSCIDYDGPGLALAESMAAVSPLKVKKLGSKSGSLGSYTGKKLNIPIITVELPYASGKLDADILWEKYGTMLVQGVLFPKEPSKGIVED